MIKENKELLHALIDQSPIAIQIMTPDGKIEQVNEAYAELWGISREELRPIHDKYNILQDEQAKILGIMPYIKRGFAGETISLPSFEYDPVKTKVVQKGRKRWIQSLMYPIKDENGEIRNVVMMQEDITEHKHAEEEFRLHSEIMINMIEGVILIRVSDGKIVYTNPKFEEIFGYSHGELIGKNISVVNAPTKRSSEEIAKDIQCSLNKTGVWSGEVYNIKKDGTPFWCYVNVSTFEHANYGKVWIGIHTNITNRKRVEKALLESEATAWALINAPTDFVFLIDAKGTILALNETAVRRFGRSPNEFLGLCVYDLFKPDLAKYRKAQADKVFRSGKPIRFEEERAGIWFDTVVYPIFNVEEEVTKVAVIARDNTEHKKIENQLQGTNKILTGILELAPLPIFTLDREGRVGFLWNKAAERVLGWSKEEIIGKPYPAIPRGKKEEFKRNLKLSFSGEGIRGIQAHRRRKDGTLIDYTIYTTPLHDEKDRVTDILAILLDVTERKRMEENLANREAELRFLLEGSDDSIYAVDSDFRYIFVNNAHLSRMVDSGRISQKRSEKVIGKRYHDLHPEKESKEFIENVRKVFETGESIQHEYKWPGTERWSNRVLSPIKDLETGNVKSVSVISRNITERKQVEEALKDNEEKLRNIFENSTNLFYSHTAEHMLTYLSPQVKDILGYTVEESMVRWTELASDNPINKKGFEQTEKAIKTGKPQSPYELELIHKSGRKVLVEVREAPIVVNGKTVSIVGALTDITERKRAEEQIKKDLKEKEVLLRELYHRTKNNMQVICSLLKLQASRLEDHKIRELFKEIETKIYSMALVHQKLLESKDLSHLNLKDYFNSLLKHFEYSYIISSDDITFHADMTDINVLIDTAVPLGLVFNELVSNSVKHAFPDNKSGEINVNLHLSHQNKIVLEVSDSGIGFPKGFDIKKDIHLGLETVIDLVEQQLDGKIRFNNQKGLHCKIIINKELYNPRV